jgi:hypothetical protein
MTDRLFSHPDFGREVRVDQFGKEVHLIFVADNVQQANSLVDTLLEQLKAGTLHLTLMGKHTP